MSGIYLVAAIVLALVMPAKAQQQTQWPITIKLANGTATTMPGSGVFYLRNSKGELLGTMVFKADRTKTFYDPSGKVVATPDVPELLAQ